MLAVIDPIHKWLSNLKFFCMHLHLLSVLRAWAASFDVPSFDILCNLAHIKMLIEKTPILLNSTLNHKRSIYLTPN